MSRPLVRAPLYQQLVDLLGAGIRSGEFPAGSRFLTERELCRRYDISRPTANKVLSALVAEGLLEFRTGVGTFVRRGIVDLRRLMSFTAQAEALGLKPWTEVRRFETVAVDDLPPLVRADLRLRVGSAHSILRIRHAGGRPLIHEDRYVPTSLVPGLTTDHLAGSLYSLLTEEYAIAIGSIDEVIRAEAAEAAIAELLDIAVGAPILTVYGTGYADDGTPIWSERTSFRGDSYEFHNIVTEGPATRPAAGALTERDSV